MNHAQLKRIRWAVRATLILGVAASVTANVLLLTVELIARVPVHRRGLAAVRFAATALIASIAAWVSYTHMLGVAQRYGETGAAPYLIPLSVDGLVVVASVCLVELAGRLRAADSAPAKIEALVPPPATPAPTPAAPQPAAHAEPAEPDADMDSPADTATTDGQLTTGITPDTTADTDTAQRPARRPFAETQSAALALHAGGWRPSQIAELLDVSDRTVRRALKPATERELASVGAHPGED